MLAIAIWLGLAAWRKWWPFNNSSSTLAAPTAPNNTIPGTGTTVQLTWTGVAKAPGYLIYYGITPTKGASEAYTEILYTAAQSGTNQTAAVTGLTAGTSYDFAIQTVDLAGNVSPLSTTTTAAIPAGNTLTNKNPGYQFPFTHTQPHPVRQ